MDLILDSVDELFNSLSLAWFPFPSLRGKGLGDRGKSSSPTASILRSSLQHFTLKKKAVARIYNLQFIKILAKVSGTDGTVHVRVSTKLAAYSLIARMYRSAE